MNLYLLRHGEAKDTNILYTEDYARPLTDEAVGALRRAARAMPRVIPSLDRILTSPLERARETARIVAEDFGGGSGVQPEVLEALSSDVSPEAIASLFSNMMGNPSILLVGHAPSLDALIWYLVAPEEKRSITHMKPGDLAHVEFELPLERRAVLRWLIPLEAW